MLLIIKETKPIDLCGSSYKDVQIIIERMSGEIYKFGDKKYNENQSLTATLPTREERESNIQEIREILSKIGRERKNSHPQIPAQQVNL